MTDNAGRLVKFILARHRVYKRREAGKPQPWSSDPILQQYKFCNIYRELDRVTRWIAVNWREPNKDDRHLWFALVVARRCINLPDTLRDLGYPIRWGPDHFLRVLERRKRKGKPIFNQAAYKLILSGQKGNLAKIQVELVLNPLWHARDKFRPHSDDTLQTFHDRLAAVPFMGSFYAAQVVADLKHVGRLRHACDWWTFVASGPGSRRGLNRILGRPPKAAWDEAEWIEELHRMRGIVVPALDEAGLPRMHVQDVQNCLCEYDKLERIRLGEGTGRKLDRKKDTFSSGRFPPQTFSENNHGHPSCEVNTSVGLWGSGGARQFDLQFFCHSAIPDKKELEDSNESSWSVLSGRRKVPSHNRSFQDRRHSGQAERTMGSESGEKRPPTASIPASKKPHPKGTDGL